MCRLCQTSQSLFEILRHSSQDPHDALLILAMTISRCIDATQLDKQQQCFLAEEVHDHVLTQIIATNRGSEAVN